LSVLAKKPVYWPKFAAVSSTKSLLPSVSAKPLPPSSVTPRKCSANSAAAFACTDPVLLTLHKARRTPGFALNQTPLRQLANGRSFFHSGPNTASVFLYPYGRPDTAILHR